MRPVNCLERKGSLSETSVVILSVSFANFCFVVSRQLETCDFNVFKTPLCSY